MECELIENDSTFLVTSSQQSGETRQAWMTHQHEKMKYFIDVEEQAITTNSASGLVNTPKKVSTESLFPCSAVASEATRQDVGGAVNEGMERDL